MLTSLLDRLERAGNRLPHPTTLFVWLCGLVVLLSVLGHWLGWTATHPLNASTIETESLASAAGVRWILDNMVRNFTGFAPLGTVLVAMLGLGICERSGLIAALLRRTVRGAPPQLLTAIVVFAGVLSSIAADAGYVVLIPLAGMMFLGAGRHPLAGIAAAFAGVSGGFSANLLIGPVDALLAGISTEAARLVEPQYSVAITANYWFMLASTLLVTLLGTLITERVVIPRLGTFQPQAGVTEDTEATADPAEGRGLRNAGIMLLACVLLILAASLPQQGVLRDPGSGSLLTGSLIRGLVPLIFMVASLCGLAYGYTTGSFRRNHDVIEAMEQTMAMMAGYLVLMFFAAQFVAWFGHSQLGLILAIHGADMLRSLSLGTVPLIVAFILLTAFLNLFIGSASAKWSVIGTVFVPMLMLTGISPELSQAAYRIGDSSTNIITPLMPYFGVVVAFVQQHQRDAGVGTIMALMLPYALVFLAGWTLLLAAWVALGWPLGPG